MNMDQITVEDVNCTGNQYWWWSVSVKLCVTERKLYSLIFK